MLIKKVLVSLLATVFCLAIAGVALAENEYVDVFPSSDQTISSSTMDAGHHMNAKSGDATTDEKQKMDDQNARPVVCAASIQNAGDLNKNQVDYCRNLYGS